MANPLLWKKERNTSFYFRCPPLSNPVFPRLSGSVFFCPSYGDVSRPFFPPSLPFSYGNRVLCSSVFFWVGTFFS